MDVCKALVEGGAPVETSCYVSTTLYTMLSTAIRLVRTVCFHPMSLLHCMFPSNEFAALWGKELASMV